MERVMGTEANHRDKTRKQIRRKAEAAAGSLPSGDFSGGSREIGRQL